jgi:hypothetical protein
MNVYSYKINLNIVLQIFCIFTVLRGACPSLKHLGQLSLFYKGGSGLSWFDVKRARPGRGPCPGLQASQLDRRRYKTPRYR